MEERVRYEKCPLCESVNFALHKVANCSKHVLYHPRLKSKINWQRCVDCGHVFTEGYFTDEACRIVFAKTQEGQKVGANLEQNRLVSSRMIEKVLPFAAAGCWLDVGFGNASLLFTAQEYGFTPIGVDLRADNVQLLNQLGIQAHCRDFGDLVLDEPCAVISMADVLEHMPYPKAALAAAHRLLKPGGVLLVSMPNAESIVWESLTTQNANPYWSEIEHYHNFGRSRLYALLSESGFTPQRFGVSERYRVCMEVVALKTVQPAA